MNTIKICEVADVVSKGTTPTSVGLSFSVKGIPFLRGEDILSSAVNFANVRMFIDESTHHILSRSALQFGDVLVTIAGTIGRIGYIDSKDTANCNQAVAFVRIPQNRVNSAWLCLLLSSPQYQEIFSQFVVGGAIPNVSLQQINSIEIPDIKIEEQRRIAARLRAQLAEVEKARKAAEVQLIETTTLADSIIVDSIIRSKTENNRLGDVLEEIKTGIGKNWADYPVLGATREGLAPAKEPPGKNPRRYKPAFPGTVFYNPMRILIGSIAFVDDDDPPGITSPDYVALKGKRRTVDSRWFYYWLRSPLGEQCINSLARGAVRERMLFNRLAEGNIELPDYDIQQSASKALAALKPMRQSVEQQKQQPKKAAKSD
jgi:type I restriction enzyme S subunit